MANTAKKKEALAIWSEHFPDLRPWKNQFLIRRNGGLLSGICLNELGVPDCYKPTFFFHNLLIPNRVVTLAYAAPLMSRGAYRSVRYGQIGDAIETFRDQAPIDQEPSLVSFIEHVVAAKDGAFGPQGIYIPHFFRDVITLGSTEPYYVEAIDFASDEIAHCENINMRIIGSVSEWKADVRAIVTRKPEDAVAEQLVKLKLPDLSDGGLRIDIISNFWTLLS